MNSEKGKSNNIASSTKRFLLCILHCYYDARTNTILMRTNALENVIAVFRSNAKFGILLV